MLLFFLVFSLLSVSAQTWTNYKIKAQYMQGSIFAHNERAGNLIQGPVRGGTLAIEFQTMGERAWHQFLNFPEIGAGLVFMDFGNPQMLGQGIALYPYMNIPLIRTNFFRLNLKPGAGVSFLNKRYSNTITVPYPGANPFRYSNSLIGSIVNAYLTLGGNVEIPIARGFSLTADYAWNHTSNGSIIQPNSGINMMNVYVGLKYAPNHRNRPQPQRRPQEDIPREFSFEITLSGGVVQLHHLNENFYGIASLAFGVYRPLSNWYRMGLGADIFYNGIFGVVNAPPGNPNIQPGHGTFQRTFIEENLFWNKIRAGISWHHEFLIGRLTAGFHFGLYLYDPIKNLEPFAEVRDYGVRNRPLIYRYNVLHQDGWLYTRAIARYAITDNLFASVALKTHLQRAEFIEWGLGWRF